MASIKNARDQSQLATNAIDRLGYNSATKTDVNTDRMDYCATLILEITYR